MGGFERQVKLEVGVRRGTGGACGSFGLGVRGARAGFFFLTVGWGGGFSAGVVGVELGEVGSEDSAEELAAEGFPRSEAKLAGRPSLELLGEEGSVSPSLAPWSESRPPWEVLVPEVSLSDPSLEEKGLPSGSAGGGSTLRFAA